MTTDPDCVHCNDTGNDASTGYEHPDFDELGCPLCNEPDGLRCCQATRTMANPDSCATCGHPIRPLAA